MRPGHHAVISLGLSALVVWGFRSWTAAFFCFLSGVFIDIDHCLDYCFIKKKFPFRYRQLLDYCEKDPQWRPYLIFHSYELLLLFWMSIYYFRLNEIWIAAALSASVHLLCDQMSNPFKLLAYFFIYRFKHGFERKEIFNDDHSDSVF